MVHARRRLLAIAVASQLALPARAAERRPFDVAPGPLGPVLRTIADQGGGEIGFAASLVRDLRSPGVRGRLTLDAALSRALTGTRLKARNVGPGQYRIEAAAEPAPSPSSPAAATPDKPPPIVVTGSKRETAQDRFPGAVRVLPTGLADARNPAIHDSADLVARLPLLQSTAFGPGRDKLFVRGIADSSFAGPTQATVGHYFGETRLLYSGSDPSIRFDDTRQIEILEGPQGTLYGAGAIGGIVRVVPNPPDAAHLAYQVAGSLAATQGGHASHAFDAMANLPLAADKAALRLVGYAVRDGGYIDNPELGLRAINGGTTEGGRAALRLVPGGDWTIDLSGLGQRIATADPQYALRGDGPLGHATALRQPYRDWIALGALTVRREMGDGPGLLATIGGVERRTRLRYDASHPPAAGPIAYDERTDTGLFDSEVRMWRTRPSGSGWVVGLSAVENWSAARRQLGPPDAQRDISGVDNRSLDLALFGETTAALTPGLSLTAGGRLTHARIDGQPLAARPQSAFVLGEARTRFDPTAAFSAKIAPGLAFYGRFARGFRAGGLAVAAGAGRVAAYRPDDISVLETGLRADRWWGGRLSGSIGLSRSWWHDIQADLVARNGFPFTANVGDGRVTALESNIELRPSARLAWTTDALFAHSSLIHPAPGFERDGGNDLPDTPKLAVATTLAWYPPIDAEKRVSVSITGRHQSHSRFGVGPLFGIDQRGFTTADATGSLLRGRYRFDLTIENIANGKGDRFAVGNPFELRERNQYTPLRPRTVRLTVTIGG